MKKNDPQKPVQQPLRSPLANIVPPKPVPVLETKSIDTIINKEIVEIDQKLNK
jgi:hypothetical protein